MLENSKWKLTNRDSFTVAYFGGSITEGAGASDYSRSWAGLTTAWLSERWPGCRVRPVQAAIGGTGSLLGAYRCREDLIRFHPDLVFLEYAVNDAGVGYDSVLNQCDAILRKLWAADPTVDVVMVYTTTKAISDRLAAGGVYESRAAYQTCAFHYGGIPQIDIGEALRERILLEGGDWLRYTKDTVHPLDNGYALCAEVLTKKLGEILDAAAPIPAPAARVVSAPMVREGSRVGAHMEDAWGTADMTGFTRIPESLCGRYPRYIEALAPGAELRYVFTGSRLDVYWMMAADSGDVICSVDGGKEKRVSSWDHYCLSFDRAGYANLGEGLAFGRHELRLRVAEGHAEGSTGTAVRIGAWLVL